MKTLVPVINELARRVGRDVRLMEVCGTHTMSAFRSGLPQLLPPNVRLISGPGCPVCVTDTNYIDAAIALCRRPGVMITTFGDLVRGLNVYGFKIVNNVALGILYCRK